MRLIIDVPFPLASSSILINCRQEVEWKNVSVRRSNNRNAAAEGNIYMGAMLMDGCRNATLTLRIFHSCTCWSASSDIVIIYKGESSYFL